MNLTQSVYLDPRTEINDFRSFSIQAIGTIRDLYSNTKLCIWTKGRGRGGGIYRWFIEYSREGAGENSKYEYIKWKSITRIRKTKIRIRKKELKNCYLLELKIELNWQKYKLNTELVGLTNKIEKRPSNLSARKKKNNQGLQKKGKSRGKK